MRYILLAMLCCFVFSATTVAQNKGKYEGMVIDKATGQPVQGASIALAGGESKVLGITDSSGHFSVATPEGASLTITHISYQNKTVKAVLGSPQTIEMEEPDAKNVDEIVVQGYRKVSKDRNVGSTVKISGEQIKYQPAASVESLLQGRVPGLNVQNISGSPGVRSVVQLRGLSSTGIMGSGTDAILTPTSPLFVIDGVPFDMNSNFEYANAAGGQGASPLSIIPPDDIEEIEVLKDAASTALWGSRGAYGVILITTKRGKGPRPVFNFSTNVFYNSVPRLREVIGGRGERDIRLQQILAYDTSFANRLGLADINRYPYYSDSLNRFYNNSVNWQSIFKRPTTNFTTNLNVSGGMKEFNYKINLGYYQEYGILQNTGLTRYSISSGLGYDNKVLNVNFNISSGITRQQVGSGSAYSQRGIAAAEAASSLLPPPSAFSENASAVAGIAAKNDNKGLVVAPNLDIRLTALKGLVLHTRFNYSLNSNVYDNFKPSLINSGRPSYITSNQKDNMLNLLSDVNYVKSLVKNEEEIHTFNLYLFNEITRSVSRGNYYLINSAGNDNLYGPVTYDFVNTRDGVVNNLFDRRSVGYGGVFTYDYRRRYVLNFQYRSEGSSNNGPNTGFVKTPNIGFTWNLHRENWFKNFKWANESRFRVSYGNTLIPTGSIFDVYGKLEPYAFTYVGKPTIVYNRDALPNVDFKPITNTTFNLGYDGEFFRSRLSLVYDFYYTSIDNDIAAIGLANTTGFGSIKVNDRSLVKYGHELAVTYRSGNQGDFSWDITVNGAYNKNYVAKLEGGLSQFTTVLSEKGINFPILVTVGGKPITTLAYNTVGVYPTDKDVAVDPVTGKPVRVGNVFLRGGSPRWTDLNGDYIIDVNDLTALYDPLPKVNGGIFLNLRYKQWSINADVTYTLFRDVLNTALADKFRTFYNPIGFDLYKSGAAIPIDQYDYWKSPGDVARYPNPFDYRTNGTIDPYRYNQSLFLEDGSYWKWNRIALNYLVKNELLRRIRVSSARIYGVLQNVFIISKYSGANPENVSTLGFDNQGAYPNPKRYSIGVNISF
ncbi:SusC/RagA family TonB-linked outer membrane protein [Niabella sp. CC-SYL272]|uniref:SusC/RagA family TonB-linked outer membrane protein n=1 Tax=Niabella agricola TaxID=2891571 RepID=UPI001F2378D0|nr:SusC/RagA family TonB-linked outer membrane protein [Niabella agricola]MCF3111790.1 SusC/RagA family TonB-linked outer membrane protein [Niabella agricola]